MKNVNLGDYLLWHGKPAKVIAETNKKQVVIELLENRRCPHCGGDLGKEQINVIVSSPLFQNEAEKIKTISDN